MLRAVASLVAPPLCALCAAPCQPREPICGSCARRLGLLRPSRTLLGGELELVSAAPYEGTARELVRKLKFATRLALAEVAAERMVRAWGATRAGCLVPVPPAPSRRRARGFDTATILAGLVARATPGSHVSACLARADGPRQVGRPRAERTADAPRVRILDPTLGAPADDPWLVDDVATTGATLLTCAEALRDGGATRVRALTFARADAAPGVDEDRLAPRQQRRSMASYIPTRGGLP